MNSRKIRFISLGLLLGCGLAFAQEKEKLSDAERARRDAEKVFSFIKFHTVRPAAAAPKPAPAPAAAARPAPRPAPAPAAAAAPAPAAVATQAAVVAAVPTPAASAPAGVAEAAAPASAAAMPGQPGVTLPPAAEPAPVEAPAPAPAPAPVEEEPDEVPLKLIAYVAPVMNSQVLSAIDGKTISVPVRFTVQPDGVVSEARSTGKAPRAVANAAVRAVQQWRFDPIPAVREVDVELAFKSEE